MEAEYEGLLTREDEENDKGKNKEKEDEIKIEKNLAPASGSADMDTSDSDDIPMLVLQAQAAMAIARYSRQTKDYEQARDLLFALLNKEEGLDAATRKQCEHDFTLALFCVDPRKNALLGFFSHDIEMALTITNCREFIHFYMSDLFAGGPGWDYLEKSNHPKSLEQVKEFVERFLRVQAAYPESELKEVIKNTFRYSSFLSHIQYQYKFDIRGEHLYFAVFFARRMHTLRFEKVDGQLLLPDEQYEQVLDYIETIHTQMQEEKKALPGVSCKTMALCRLLGGVKITSADGELVLQALEDIDKMILEPCGIVHRRSKYGEYYNFQEEALQRLISLVEDKPRLCYHLIDGMLLRKSGFPEAKGFCLALYAFGFFSNEIKADADKFLEIIYQREKVLDEESRTEQKDACQTYVERNKDRTDIKPGVKLNLPSSSYQGTGRDFRNGSEAVASGVRFWPDQPKQDDQKPKQDNQDKSSQGSSDNSSNNSFQGDTFLPF